MQVDEAAHHRHLVLRRGGHLLLVAVAPVVRGVQLVHKPARVRQPLRPGPVLRGPAHVPERRRDALHGAGHAVAPALAEVAALGVRAVRGDEALHVRLEEQREEGAVREHAGVHAAGDVAEGGGLRDEPVDLRALGVPVVAVGANDGPHEGAAPELRLEVVLVLHVPERGLGQPWGWGGERERGAGGGAGHGGREGGGGWSGRGDGRTRRCS